jgi:superkiller protein 3
MSNAPEEESLNQQAHAGAAAGWRAKAGGGFGGGGFGGGQFQRFAKVRELMQSGQLDEARTLVEQFIASDPSFPMARLMLGNIHMRQGEHEAAVAEYERVLELNPRLAMAALMAAMAKDQAGEVDAAEEYLRRAIDIDPEMEMGHFQLAKLLIEREEMAAAEVSVNDGLRLNPQNTYGRLLQAEILDRMSRDDDAIMVLQRFLRDRPTFTLGFFMLGMIYRKLDKMEEARQTFKDLVAAAPDKSFSHFLVGEMHFELEELNAAEKAFRDALDCNEKFVPAQYRLADTLVKLEQYPEAVSLLLEILRRAGRKNSVHQRLGEIYAAQQRYDEALEEFRAALGCDKRLVEADPELPRLVDAAAGDERKISDIAQRIAAILAETRDRREHRPGLWREIVARLLKMRNQLGSFPELTDIDGSLGIIS